MAGIFLAKIFFERESIFEFKVVLEHFGAISNQEAIYQGANYSAEFYPFEYTKPKKGK